jgi:hypothetical protein
MEYFRSLKRQVAAAGLRAANGDPDLLAALFDIQTELDRALRIAVEGQRAAGMQWKSIGEALHVTGQAASMRFGNGGTFNAKAPANKTDPGRQAGRQ